MFEPTTALKIHSDSALSFPSKLDIDVAQIHNVRETQRIPIKPKKKLFIARKVKLPSDHSDPAILTPTQL